MFWLTSSADVVAGTVGALFQFVSVFALFFIIFLVFFGLYKLIELRVRLMGQQRDRQRWDGEACWLRDGELPGTIVTTYRRPGAETEMAPDVARLLALGYELIGQSSDAAGITATYVLRRPPELGALDQIAG